MDLIPTPDQVVAAAGNVAHSVLYGGLADLRPMPRTLVDSGVLRELYHYRPAAVTENGDPVLLVAPLAAPSLCYDLRRGCSLVQHLVEQGRPTYLVEYGEVSFKDRDLGMDHWVDEIVPAAIRETSAHAGGRPVHVVGWSLGGLFSVLTAADRPDLPIASLSVLGAPVDMSQVPLVAPLRPLVDLGSGPGLASRAYRLLGGAPASVAWVSELASFQKLVTKPLALATHLDDAEYLAQIEAVGRFSDQVVAYQGRTFGQVYHRFVKGNALVSGKIELGGRTIALSDVTAPVLVLAGATDGIAPLAAVRALAPMLTGSADVQLEIVPGGHLGMLTGRAARDSTWVALDDWITTWSSRAVPVTKAARKTAAKKSAAKKSAAKKTVAKKAVAKKSVARKAATKKTSAKNAATKKAVSTKAATTKSAGPDGIGANPQRRYGSDGSRDLAR